MTGWEGGEWLDQRSYPVPEDIILVGEGGQLPLSSGQIGRLGQASVFWKGQEWCHRTLIAITGNHWVFTLACRAQAACFFFTSSVYLFPLIQILWRRTHWPGQKKRKGGPEETASFPDQRARWLGEKARITSAGALPSTDLRRGSKAVRIYASECSATPQRTTSEFFLGLKL